MSPLTPAQTQRALHFYNKNAAMLAGRMKFEGMPCKRGHTVRYTKTGMCTECNLDRAYASRARRRCIQSARPGGSLTERVAELEAKLRAALLAEAHAWERVAALEDKYEPGLHGDMS
ncbi:MAG: hypothetical protein ACRERX_04255 [Pseudomonas sp.]